jgi:hypothetical protein
MTAREDFKGVESKRLKCSKLQNIFESQRFTNSLNYINFQSVDDAPSLTTGYSLSQYKVDSQFSCFLREDYTYVIVFVNLSNNSPQTYVSQSNDQCSCLVLGSYLVH